MKLKTQAVLALLFLASFVKSFKFSSNGYDIVFIILVSVLYLAQEFISEQKTKDDLKKLTEHIDTRLNQQDEQIESVKNNTSKMALGMGIKR